MKFKIIKKEVKNSNGYYCAIRDLLTYFIKTTRFSGLKRANIDNISIYFDYGKDYNAINQIKFSYMPLLDEVRVESYLLAYEGAIESDHFRIIGNAIDNECSLTIDPTNIDDDTAYAVGSMLSICVVSTLANIACNDNELRDMIVTMTSYMGKLQSSGNEISDLGQKEIDELVKALDDIIPEEIVGYSPVIDDGYFSLICPSIPALLPEPFVISAPPTKNDIERFYTVLDDIVCEFTRHGGSIFSIGIADAETESSARYIVCQKHTNHFIHPHYIIWEAHLGEDIECESKSVLIEDIGDHVEKDIMDECILRISKYLGIDKQMHKILINIDNRLELYY